MGEHFDAAKNGNKKLALGKPWHILLYGITVATCLCVYIWLSTSELRSSDKTHPPPSQPPVAVTFYYYNTLPNRRKDHNVTRLVPVATQATPKEAEKTASASRVMYKSPYHGVICTSGPAEGVCYSRGDCEEKAGKRGVLCMDQNLACCIFQHSCGDISGERTTYFRSPDYPGRSTGTLACDYDVTIQSDVCAVRVEFEKVDLARKLGGVCDIDQLFILNSVDGPTTGQCGPLSGYSTTVAVTPGQTKPVKLALLIQNEGYYRWSIKIVQLRCTELSNFQVPVSCGRQEWDAQTSSSELSHSFFNLWHDIKWRRDNTRYQGGTWWSFPEPVFNTFYYGTMKKHLQQSPHALQRDRMYKAQDRIVGGTDAALYEFPWQVAIFLEDLFFCGGAVINELFVLTAAHCIMTRDTPIEQLVLQIGDHDLSTMNETAHDVRKVKRISYHSHFHPFLLSNDIALLELDKPVTFSNRIRPVCLPESGESYTGRRGYVVGWGITSFPQGEPSPILQKLIVETISNFQCSRIIEEPVGLGMICAAPDSLEGTCFGDSGGPLTVLDPDETDVLIGIVSFGVTGCAVIPAFPDLYTRVTEYLKWIDVNAMQ